MRLRYKTAMFFIACLIGGCIFLSISYFLYKRMSLNKAEVVADGNITINYLNGSKLSYKKDTVNFSVTNNGVDEEFYYIEFKDVNADNVKYKLVSNDNNINIENDLTKDIVSSYISIKGRSTQNYVLTFTNPDKYEFYGQLVIAKEKNEEAKTMFADAILKNNKVVEAKTKFDTVALENEGLIKTLDDSGNTYYFRGNITNNYVLFSGYTWRIVRINGDGSIKLVLDNLLENVSAYTTSKENYSYLESEIKKVLDDFYRIRLSDYADYITNHKFCNDMFFDETTSNYASYNRLSVNFIPNDVCLSNQISSKIGLLTADEAIMAGASSTENKSYYLFNDKISTSYYTMTSAKIDSNSYYPYSIKVDGSLDLGESANLLRGVRPVINITKNIEVTGDGTINNPYKLVIENNNN